MSMDTLKRLEENNRTKTTNANFIRYDLFYAFNKCCKITVKDLRDMALERLPGAVDERKTSTFPGFDAPGVARRVESYT